MADQRITELVELPQGGVASSDVLPIADVSASQTKKVQVKSLIQAGFNLADSSTLDISKINQSSVAKLTGASIAPNTLTYDKIQQVGANKLLGRSATTGNVEEIDCTVYIRTLLDDANAAAARSTLELGVVATGDTINTALLENLSVTTGKINDLAVTAGKLASDAVETAKILNGAVTSAKIQTSGITGANVSAGAIDTVHLAASGVTLAKMAASSVGTTQLVDSGITQVKLAADAISTVNIVDSGITQPKLAADSVATVNIIDSGITQPKLAADAVATINILDSGITQSKLASGAVDTVNLVDSGVTFAKLASGSVDTVNLVDSGITQPKLASGAVATINLADSGITQPKLASGSVDTVNIIDAAVTLVKMASGSVDTDQLVDSGVTQAKLASDSIDTVNIIDAAVTLAKMASGSVDTAQLVASGITQGKLAASSVDTINLTDSGVTQVKLAANAVATINLLASGVTQGKLAADAVATINIADSGVTQSKLSSDAVATINLVDSGITTAKLASGAVTIEKLSLSAGELSGTVITASSIPSGSYEVGSISTDAIEDNAVTFAKIQQVASGVLLGRASAGSGDVEAITLTEAGRALLDDADADAQRTTLGLGTMAVQAASGVAITGGTAVLSSGTISYATINGGVISGITDLAIEDGGTGASTASGARTNLGLAIGSDVQAYDAALASIAGLTTASGQLLYTTASDTYGTATITAAGRALLDDADASAQRTTLGLGTLAVQNTVASGDYDAGSIVTADIADGAITTAKFVDSGVTTIKIANANITADKLASDSVTTVKIIDSGVTTAKIANGAVSYAKIQATSTSDVLLGRSSASGGTVEEIPCTSAARSILDDASVADIRTTLGLGTLATQNGSFSGTSTGTNTGDQTITLSGDVTGTGTGAFATTIANSAITSVKILDSAVTTAKIIDSGVTAIKLSDNSAVIVAGSTPTGDGDFIGQQWLNTNTGFEYTWTGAAWQRESGLATAVISGDTVYSFTTSYPDSFSASIAPSLNAQVATRFFAGPASGIADAAPTFRAITADDLPKATSAALGVAQAGTGLITVSGIFNHANSVASGVYYKVTVDEQGHVSFGEASLVADDIPSIPASKITTGTFGSGFIEDEAILASKLANYSVSQFGEAPPTADFIGQFFFNPLEKDLYLWDGNVWNPVGISIGEIIFGGTYNASGNTIASVSADGAGIGLSIGQPLPAASVTFNRYYVVVESGGTGTSPAPETELQPPDLLLCNGTAWVEIDVSSTYLSQTASNVAFSPAGTIGSTNVQSAIEEVNTECRNVNNVASGILSAAYGGTGQNTYATGDILVASGTVLAKKAVGTNGQVLTADSAFGTGVRWATPASGTVLSVSATSPIAVVSGTTTPVISIPDASTSVRGSVQLTDSTSTTSSSLAATATAVKSAFDLANAALPRAGGTITGAVIVGTTGSIQFEGSTDDAFETTLTAADPTADHTITLPNVNGTVITTGDTGTVTNTMLAGSIADTKLNTISTAGKVSNSATTATSANTLSAIVARDGSGNFSAGTISATIDEGTF
jgi:hypothetical protein